MYSVYVSRQTDSARQITELHFHALEIFKTKVLLLLFYIAYARSSTAAGIQASIFRFWWKGKDLTLQKVSFLFPSPLPEAWCNTCLISRGTRKGWASRHLHPKILHASFFIHAARNVPSLAQLHLNTLVLPNTWLDFPLSK